MPTHFGKFISGKWFSHLFLLLYVLFMFFAAKETNSALCLLTNQPHLYGMVYILFALVGSLIITKKKVSEKWHNKTYKKIISFSSCYFIYYVLALTLWELLSFIFRVSEKTKAFGVVSAVTIAAVVVLCGYLHTKIIDVKHYKITLNGGTKPYRIVMMSDIHLGIFVRAKHIRRIVKKINANNPDLVVIAGDIFDTDNSLLEDKQELKKISKILSNIKAKNGVYAVLGNHDPKVNDRALQHFLKRSKIKLLDNKVAVLSKINLVGRTDAANNTRKEMTELLSKVDDKKPIVVLDHKPQEIDDAAEHGASLVLCGHTHRGQLFPITIFTRLANGNKYFYGYKRFGKTHGIISSGVGFFELPVRIGSSNEIVVIDLQV